MVPALMEAHMRSLIPVLAILAGTSALAAPNADVVDVARAHLDHDPAQAATTTLHTERVTDWTAGTFVRFEQHLGGIPVERGSIVVNLDPTDNVRRVVGERLPETDLSLVPTLTVEAGIAAADAVTDQLFGERDLWPSRGELRVWEDRDGDPRLVWAVDSSSAEPLGTYRSLVDAHTGEVVAMRPTLRHAKAEVYAENPQVSELSEVELPRLTGDGTTMRGENGRVVSCIDWGTNDFGGGECKEKASLAIADDAGDFFFEPNASSADDPFAEVQMYYHLDKVAQYFADAHGFRHRTPIEAIVNFDYDNAFFGDADGDGVGEIAFGQNSRADFGYDGDVVYHEFVHSVFNEIATSGFFGADEYGLDVAAGSLNEGSADLFSLVLTGDPQLGEYAGRGFGLNGPVRDLDVDLRCPDNLYGESHEDGKIWGAMGWKMIADDRVGPDVVGQLIFGVLEAFPRQITWKNAGETLVTVAGDMLDAGAIDQTTHDAILEHAENAGFPGCERIIPLDTGLTPTMYTIFAAFGGIQYLPVTAQFSLDAPEHTTEVRFQIDEWRVNQPAMAWTVFVRRGDFIRHEVEANGFFDVPVPTDFDFYVDGDDELPNVVLNEFSDPPLIPGETYYFSLAARDGGGLQGFAGGEVTVSGQVTIVEPEPVPEPEENVRACGCDSATGGLGALFLFPLISLVARRRRR